MKRGSVMSLLCASAVLLSSTSAFALTPWEYDGQTYESLGLSSSDPDGEINLAVIANDDVVLGNTMYIEGSIYTTGDICTVDGDGNTINGLFISGTGDHTYGAANEGDTTTYTTVGYKIIDTDGNEKTTTAYDSKPTYNGAIYDPDTSFDCVYTDYTVPVIENVVEGKTEANGYVTSITISEDTYYEELELSAEGLIIDATNNPVTVVIDQFDRVSSDPYFTVLGDNKVDIYVNKIVQYGTEINKFKIYTQKELNYINSHYEFWSVGEMDVMKTALEGLSSKDQLTFYIGASSSFDAIEIEGSRAYANIVTKKDLTITESSYIIGDVECGGDYTMTSSNAVWGVVCAPNATTFIGQGATLYGQLHTKTLDMSGAGAIIYQADSLNESPAATTAPEATDVPEDTPTEEPTEAPTTAPAAPPASGDEEIFAGSSQYAYIFGDEPLYIAEAEDEEGNVTEWTVEVNMQPDREVSRQEACAMIMRLVDQYKGVNADRGDIADAVTDCAEWAEKGMGYLSKKGAYDDISYTVSGYESPTRGEVAKLVVKGLDLALQEGAIEFTDTAGTEFEQYINIMTSNGYMQGDGNGEFRPGDFMTRAEFCSMFNNVTGRTNYELVDTEGNSVKPATYYIVDLDGADSWKVNAMILGTSAFTADKKVDVATRIANIRNVLDNYNGQKQY